MQACVSLDSRGPRCSIYVSTPRTSTLLCERVFFSRRVLRGAKLDILVFSTNGNLLASWTLEFRCLGPVVQCSQVRAGDAGCFGHFEG
eukprot:3788045-Amphidinium_carterae.1